jgi:hypothetical protein
MQKTVSSTCHTNAATKGPGSSSDGHLKLEKQLKILLKKHFGSTKHKEVLKTIDELTPHNPTPEPTKSPLLIGDFICHTLPEFPGRIKTENKENPVYARQAILWHICSTCSGLHYSQRQAVGSTTFNIQDGKVQNLRVSNHDGPYHSYSQRP